MSKDFTADKNGFGPDILASNTIATDRDDQNSSMFHHVSEQRKFTLEKAKAHYSHVKDKFRVDKEGNLLELA